MNTFRLIVSSPEGELFNGQAEALFVRGSDGDLAVLAGHIPLVTAVQACICRVILSDGKERTAKCGGGILKVGTESTTLLSSRFSWQEETAEQKVFA